jgi:hypothetical protein
MKLQVTVHFVNMAPYVLSAVCHYLTRPPAAAVHKVTETLQADRTELQTVRNLLQLALNVKYSVQDRTESTAVTDIAACCTVGLKKHRYGNFCKSVVNTKSTAAHTVLTDSNT